jgi:DNA-binding response OmpR family regulator
LNTHPRTILCIDAEGDPWNLRSGLLAGPGLRADVARSADEALQLLRNRRYAAVVIGNSLTDVTGTQLCRDLRRFDERTPVILVGEADDKAAYDEAQNAGAHAYVPRHLAPTNLVDLVAQLVTQNESDVKSNYKKASSNKN